MLLSESHIARFFATPLGRQAQLFSLRFVFESQILAGHQRSVHGIEGEVCEERFMLVGGDKPDRFGRQTIRQMFTGRAVGETRIAIGREILVAAIGTAAIDATHVHVEPLLFWPPAFGAQVPLACEERGVPGVVQGLGQRRCFQRQAISVGGRQELRIAFPVGGP